MLQESARIIFHQALNREYFRLGITCDAAYQNAVPGQFVTVKIPDRHEPLLRRPFSIHRLHRQNGRVTGIEILYRVVGGFTRNLSEKQAGETVDLLGPLGRGFSMPADVGKPVLVAGGIGVAPMMFLAEALYAAGKDLSAAHLFYGGRTETDILCRPEFEQLDLPVTVTTEDGSAGQPGMVTEPLQTWIAGHRPDVIYACGPHGLLSAVTDIAAYHGIYCEVSIETVMACGLGVCMGCAIEARDKPEGYRHVCRDGPVFDAAMLKF
ncbi:MAG: dihydroorotate dehydrogenase electron transfer subunit [Thermodesulfobacteriota bacterium]